MALVARIYPLARRGLSDEAIGYPERLHRAIPTAEHDAKRTND
jgi:hypothetical protein